MKGRFGVKQLADRINWKASQLRRRIGELKTNLKNAPETSKVYLRRRDLKNSFCLMIGHDREHCHTIRDAEEMAEAGAVQTKRLQMKELETAQKNLKLLELVLDEYLDDDILSLLNQLPKAYRGLPWNPACGGPGGSTAPTGDVPPDRQVLFYPECIAAEANLDDRAWAAANTERNQFQPERRKVRTSFGLMVRSKSEMMIAEQLRFAGLPFRYEPEILLRDSGQTEKWYPDFEIRIGRDWVVFWEHLGMMDNEDYVQRSREKTRRLVDNRIWFGRNLIMTMEDETQPLDINEVIARVEMLRFLARKGSNNENNGSGYANF